MIIKFPLTLMNQYKCKLVLKYSFMKNAKNNRILTGCLNLKFSGKGGISNYKNQILLIIMKII